MSDQDANQEQQYTLAELIQHGEKSFTSDVYANHVQVVLTNNELFLDFYYISPQASEEIPVKAVYAGRIIAPVGMAKGIATALANVVANHEEKHGIVMPNSRKSDQEDKITIWP